METIEATVKLGVLSVKYSFIVVDHLTAPAILGCNFLVKQDLVMDFQNSSGNPLLGPVLLRNRTHPSIQHEKPKEGRMNLIPNQACMLIIEDEHLFESQNCI